MDSKAAILVFEGIVNFFHDEGELFGQGVDSTIFLLCAAIEENVFLPGMAVNIDVHGYFLLLVGLADEFPHEIYLRLSILLAVLPFPVQITSVARESVVAPDNSVGVEHGHYFEQKVRSKKFAVLVLSD